MWKRWIVVLIALLLASAGSKAQVMLDSSFGANGRYQLAYNKNKLDLFKSMTVRPNGEIYALCRVIDPTYTVRYASLGLFCLGDSLAGKPSLKLKKALLVTPGSYRASDWAWDNLAVQSSGRVICTGIYDTFTNAQPINRDELFRGVAVDSGTWQPDPSIGQNGHFMARGLIDNVSVNSTVQSDDKIIQVGQANTDWGMVRYRANGEVDSAFGQDGLVTTYVGKYGGFATDVKQLMDGRILVLGIGYRSAPLYNDFLLIRYLPDGRIDATFGVNGYVWTDLESDYDRPTTMAIQPDGRIVVTGYSGYDRMTLVRYLPNGALDTTFNHTGILMKDNNGYPLRGIKVLVQPNGKILVAGNAYLESSGQERDFAIFRCWPDGTPDTTFSSGGLFVINLGERNREELYTMALQPDGRILLGGDANGATLIRLLVKEPEQEQVQAVIVAPNPSNGSFAVQSKADGVIVIYDMLGRRIGRSDIRSGSTPVALGQVAAGMYTWVFRSSNGRKELGKLLIQY